MIELVWDTIKGHINAAEIDNYARRVGIARITRNEEAFSEYQMLKQMQNTIEANITDEIDKKNPTFLITPQRTKTINQSIQFLDNLKNQGHYVDPSNENDSAIIKYLKYTRATRPNTSDPPQSPQRTPTPLSGRRITNIEESIESVQKLIEEEYTQIQQEIANLRSCLFSSCEQLDEVKQIEPPTTESIEAFNKRLHTQEITLKNMSKLQTASSVNRLRESIRLNRVWE